MSIYSVTSSIYLRIRKFPWSNNNSIYEIMNWASRRMSKKKKNRLWRFADDLFAINWLDYHAEMNSSSPSATASLIASNVSHRLWRKSFSYLHGASIGIRRCAVSRTMFTPSPLLLKRTGKLMIGKDRSLVLSIEVTKGISKRQRPFALTTNRSCFSSKVLSN